MGSSLAPNSRSANRLVKQASLEFAGYSGPMSASDEARAGAPRKTALERVRAIRGVTFEWRDESMRDSRPRVMGVIAQEVEEAFPEAVITDENGLKLVDYTSLTAALIEAVKELAERVEELERRGSAADPS
jgi:t-SNARE complex subunit (syntaxin)